MWPWDMHIHFSAAQQLCMFLGVFCLPLWSNMCWARLKLMLAVYEFLVHEISIQKLRGKINPKSHFNKKRHWCW